MAAKMMDKPMSDFSRREDKEKMMDECHKMGKSMMMKGKDMMMGMKGVKNGKGKKS